MIHLDVQPEQMSPEDRFGLSLLVDLARLLPVPAPAPEVVTLSLESGSGAADDMTALQAPVRVGDGRVAVPRELVRAATRIAAAVTEQASAAADRHGRVPSTAAAPVAAGLWTEPVVSAAAIRLRAAVLRAAGGRPLWLAAPWPEGRRWAASFTHDLDLVAGWPAATALRTAELLRHGAVGQAARVVPAALAAVVANPVVAGTDRLLRRLARHGVRATWFVIAGSPTIGSWLRGDVTYRAGSRRVRELLARVTAEGHEVGLHGSFATLTDAARMSEERQRLTEVCGRPVTGVRQHFLRIRPGRTQRAMIQAGFEYDATAGFPDRNGFRLGLADPAPWWDAGQAQETGLEQVPLIWMDRAQSKYEGEEDPFRWVEQGLRLAGACRAAEGLWVGLWHPNLTAALGYPGAEAALDHLLQSLLEERPFVAPLTELVAWRRRRRAARVASVRPDGPPLLAGDPIPLEQVAPEHAA